MLGYADYSKTFNVHTYSSSYGLGSVLYQKQEGVEQVNAFASRGLRPAEKSYPAHKLEIMPGNGQSQIIMITFMTTNLKW